MSIYSFYTQYFVQIILTLFGMSVVLSMVCLIRLSFLNKKYKKFMDALSDKDVEKLLLENMETVKKVSEGHDKVAEEIKEAKNTFQTCFQKYGLVRYTAFEDVGSDLSFAIALLDGQDDGFVLNGIYTREGSTVYAKPIRGGETKHNLSDEEKKALEKAKRRG